jgi:hypothetical protein
VAAASAFEAALDAVSKTDHPLIWAELADDLGLMDEILGQHNRDKATLQRGRDKIVAAWDIYRARDASHDEEFSRHLELDQTTYALP